MKKAELAFQEILFQALEKKNRSFTQAELSRTLNISLSIINNAVKNLEKIGAVEIRKRSFHLIDPKKALYFWASQRNLQKDILYSTRAEMPVKEIEKSLPDKIIFGAFSTYKFQFQDVPADYSEVYVYASEEEMEELKKRFPEKKGPANLIVLKKVKNMEKYGRKTTLALTFVDLWNLKEWYAKEFIKSLEVKLNGILEFV